MGEKKSEVEVKNAVNILQSSKSQIVFWAMSTILSDIMSRNKEGIIINTEITR